MYWGSGILEEVHGLQAIIPTFMLKPVSSVGLVRGSSVSSLPTTPYSGASQTARLLPVHHMDTP